MNLLKIARILDANGNYLLADKLDKIAQQGENEIVEDNKNQQDLKFIIPKFLILLKEYIQEDLFSRIGILDKLKEKDYEYLLDIPIVNNFTSEYNLNGNESILLEYCPLIELMLRSEFYKSKAYLIDKTIEIFKKLIDSGTWTLDTALEVLKGKNSFKDFLLKREFVELQGFLLQPKLIGECFIRIKPRILYLYLKDQKQPSKIYRK